MTKSELIEAITARGEFTRARAELVVNCVFDTMTDALRSAEGIEIRGFRYRHGVAEIGGLQRESHCRRQILGFVQGRPGHAVQRLADLR